jgi:Flp pilus assembly pilin Flp
VVEYVLILALVAIVLIVALTSLGQTVPGPYNQMAEELDGL